MAQTLHNPRTIERASESRPVASSPIADSLARPRLEALTSLRCFAAAAVVIVHLQGHLGVPMIADDPTVFMQSVTFFFVLSGFILTYVYRRLGPGRNAAFWRARVARVWPAHAAMLVLAALVLPVAGGGARAAGWFALQATLLQSWVPSGPALLAYNGVSWTVSTEFAFYAAFPLLLWLSRRHAGLAWGAALAVSLGTALVANALIAHHHAEAGNLLVYVNPLGRGFEFATGVLAALVVERLRRGSLPSASRARGTALELAALALAVVAISATGLLQFGPGHVLDFGAGVDSWLRQSAMTAVPIAVFIGVLSFERGALSRVLQVGPLVLLGELSYSIYLLHWMMIQYYIGHPSLFRPIPAPMLLPLFLALLLGLSLASRAFVELPGRRWINGVGRRRRALAASPATPRRRHLLAVAASLAGGVAGMTMLASASGAPTARLHEVPLPASVIGHIDLVGGTAVAVRNSVTLSRSARGAASVPLVGWVSDRRDPARIRGAYLEVDGHRRQWMQYGSERPDIASYLHSKAFSRVGYTTALDVRHLAPGTHQVAVLVVPRHGATFSRQLPLRVVVEQ
jgi:peptidoglycan/LPS O-acetylase OafA/YrhL